MKRFLVICGFITLLILLGIILVYTVDVLAKKDYITDKVLIALIASLSAILTITGSVFTNKFLTNEQLRKEKSMEFLKIKREFYSEYVELFLMRITYMNSRLLWTDEAMENERKLLINKMRLPLYASQDLIEFFERSYLGKTDFSEFFELIRRDLSNSNITEFKNLKQISVHLPNIVINSSLQKQLDKVEKDYKEFKDSKLFVEFEKILLDGSYKNGIKQTNDNMIVISKLRIKKILDYNYVTNTFGLSMMGFMYLDNYNREKLYNQDN